MPNNLTQPTSAARAAKPLTAGQRVRIRPEFCDRGQSDIIHVITEDEDGGR